MKQNEDWTELCAFLRRSRYSVIQVYTDDQWGRAWTYAPTDVRAAERVGRQMRRVFGSDVRLRIACRARLRMTTRRNVVVGIVTEMPGRNQVILDLETARSLPDISLFMDEALLALAQACGHMSPDDIGVPPARRK